MVIAQFLSFTGLPVVSSVSPRTRITPLFLFCSFMCVFELLILQIEICTTLCIIR